MCRGVETAVGGGVYHLDVLLADKADQSIPAELTLELHDPRHVHTAVPCLFLFFSVSIIKLLQFFYSVPLHRRLKTL